MNITKISILKIACVSCLLLIFTLHDTWSQYSVDPYSQIYEDIDLWYGRGYIEKIPTFRPLPEVLLVPILNEVIAMGNDEAVRKASRYLTEINTLTIYTTVSGYGYLNMVGGDIPEFTRMHGNGTIEVSGAARINKFISIAVSLSGHLVIKKDADDLSATRTYAFVGKSMDRQETLEDIRIGSLSSATLYMGLGNRAGIAIGNDTFVVHSGYMRRSIGPFFDDGIIVSPKAPQSPNIFAYWQGKQLAATWGFFSLSSSQEYLKFSTQESLTSPSGYEVLEAEASTQNKINKFFFYNSLTWNPSRKFELSIYESIMFGNFNLGYILPIKIIYAVDSGSDFAAGNLIVGFAGKYKPIQTLTFPFSILIDDISVSNYLRFNFYSKLKAAAEVGAQWHPNHPIFKSLKLGYQIVTPYTYTHPPTETYELYSTAYNTENHTHQNQHFATSLKPNSHRVYAELEFSPISFLTIGTLVKMEQHANASYGILQGPLNDGSIVDDGYRSIHDNSSEEEDATFQNRMDFLSTGKIETKWEAGINFSVLYPLARKINLFTDINYSYRYTNNYDLTDNSKTESIFQMELGITIRN